MSKTSFAVGKFLSMREKNIEQCVAIEESTQQFTIGHALLHTAISAD
jgi:hypothetical protein